jgi:hypothetical protein
LGGSYQTVAKAASAPSGAVATYYDTLRLESDTLAVGTQVDLLLGFTVTYSISGASCGAVQAQINGTASGVPYAVNYQDNCGTVTGLTSAIVSASIGDYIPIAAILNIRANGGVPLNSSSTVDAGNSLNLLVIPQGAFTYTTASGNHFTPSAL